MPRKKPFSAKQKKEQLKKKRQISERKQDKDPEHGDPTTSEVHSNSDDESLSSTSSYKSNNNKLKKEIIVKTKNDPERFKLLFRAESEKEIEERKRKARLPLVRFSPKQLEFSLEDIYKPGTVLDMPKRPQWSYKMEKREVEHNEEQMFRKYLDKLNEEMSSEAKLSYFEMNLETWRQLWRVLEVSDIVVIITDVRYPVIHFSPTLYDYIQLMNKHVILVLNKIDLIAAEVVVAWKDYFHTKFPELNIVCFTSFPKDPEVIKEMQSKVKKGIRRRQKKSFVPVGPRELHGICEKIMNGKVNLKEWFAHIEEQEHSTSNGVTYDDLSSDEDDSTLFEDVEKQEDILTIGLVGHPNVGKSSLLNGLIGKKVVSCSRTPGHTKHFQTIFLTPNVRLCDSPGLVFPSLVDRRLQILSGTYPISQVREPYSVVGYLASCIPLEKLLKLTHPRCMDGDDGDCNEYEWSAWDICDAWAEKNGFYTAKAGRPDTYRAANNLLRLATQGKIVVCLYPPDFDSNRDVWRSHTETMEIAKLQQQCSDLKQWKLDVYGDPSNDSSDHESSSDDKSCDEETIYKTNPFELLNTED